MPFFARIILNKRPRFWSLHAKPKPSSVFVGRNFAVPKIGKLAWRNRNKTKAAIALDLIREFTAAGAGMTKNRSDISVQIVRRQIQKLNPSACVELETVARTLDTSPRSLQRKLAEQGVSFSELVGALKQRRAMQLLKGSDLAVADVAHKLGYQDTSNFCRAFTRWTGLSPHQWRRTKIPKEGSQRPN